MNDIEKKLTINEYEGEFSFEKIPQKLIFCFMESIHFFVFFNYFSLFSIKFFTMDLFLIN